jgi:chaperonin GroES
MTEVVPLADRAYVKRIAPKERTDDGLFIPDDAQEVPEQADVLAIGRELESRVVNGMHVPPFVSVGDRILIGRFAGTKIKVDGEERLIVTKDEILAIIRESA